MRKEADGCLIWRADEFLGLKVVLGGRPSLAIKCNWCSIIEVGELTIGIIFVVEANWTRATCIGKEEVYS